MTNYGKGQIAKENAFRALIDSAHNLQLNPQTVMGFEYLPDPKVKEQFALACRAVLECLGVTGIEPNIAA